MGILRRLASLCFGRQTTLNGVNGVNGAPSPVKVIVAAKGANGHGAAVSSRTTHEETGKNKSQAPGVDGPTKVTIVSITDETPAVKVFRLRVDNRPAATDGGGLAFKPGQWVDFFAPGVEKPGGFSIASAPEQLVRDGTFDLAVKRSGSNKAAQWIHAARIGDAAHVCVGGKFFASDEDLSGPLLLIAGGIGISPLYGILCALMERYKRHGNGTGPAGDAHGGTVNTLQAVLLYSGKAQSEHALAASVRALETASRGAVRCVFYVTGTAPPSSVNGGATANGNGGEHSHSPPVDGTAGDGSKGIEAREENVRYGRVDGAALKAAIAELEAAAGNGQPGQVGQPNRLTNRPVTAFLCGPPAMSDAMEAALLEQGLPQSSVRLERWW